MCEHERERPSYAATNEARILTRTCHSCGRVSVTLQLTETLHSTGKRFWLHPQRYEL